MVYSTVTLWIKEKKPDKSCPYTEIKIHISNTSAKALIHGLIKGCVLIVLCIGPIKHTCKKWLVKASIKYRES